jgi:hypothetical protein
MLSTILLIALIFAFPPNQAGLNSEAALRNQVERYHSYFSNGRYGLMWEMLSKTVREKNDNDKKAYIRQLRKYGYGKAKAEISKIEIGGDRAIVRVKISVWSTPDKKWLREVDNETWVLENGRWVFEDHQAAESATSGEGA